MYYPKMASMQSDLEAVLLSLFTANLIYPLGKYLNGLKIFKKVFLVSLVKLLVLVGL